MDLVPFPKWKLRLERGSKPGQRPRFHSQLSDPFFEDFFSGGPSENPTTPEELKDKPWYVRLNVRGYKPEEVKVSQEPGTIVVQAHHADGEDFSQIRRTFAVPDDVDVRYLHSEVTPNGVLVIQAPHKQKERPDFFWGGFTEMQKEFDEMSGYFNHIRNLASQSEVDQSAERRMKKLLNWGDMSIPGCLEAGGEIEKYGDSSEYKIHFDLSQYSPEEVSIKLDGRNLTLTAKHEETSDTHHSTRAVNRTIFIPDGVDVEHLKSKMMEDGILELSAPIKSLALKN